MGSEMCIRDRNWGNPWKHTVPSLVYGPAVGINHINSNGIGVTWNPQMYISTKIPIDGPLQCPTIINTTYKRLFAYNLSRYIVCFDISEAGFLIVSEIVPRSCPGPDSRVNVYLTSFLE